MSYKFHHVSTDEVFGNVENSIRFTEETKYNPKNPYSASKASSDHLVRSWINTYEIPAIITIAQIITDHINFLKNLYQL